MRTLLSLLIAAYSGFAFHAGYNASAIGAFLVALCISEISDKAEATYLTAKAYAFREIDAWSDRAWQRLGVVLLIVFCVTIYITFPFIESRTNATLIGNYAADIYCGFVGDYLCMRTTHALDGKGYGISELGLAITVLGIYWFAIAISALAFACVGSLVTFWSDIRPNSNR